MRVSPAWEAAGSCCQHGRRAAVERSACSGENVQAVSGGQRRPRIASMRRFCGGGETPTGKELVRAICLSLLDDPQQVQRLYEQDWVETWDGWQELARKESDDMAMDVAKRFLQIAGTNAPTDTVSNRQRLKELEADGLELLAWLQADWEWLSAKHYAQPVGNSCVQNMACQVAFTWTDIETLRASSIFFLQEQWNQDVSVRVVFYDALDHKELQLAEEELQHIDFTWGNKIIYERIVLRVYNQTLPTGQGYHFDALVSAAPCLENMAHLAETVAASRKGVPQEMAQGSAAANGVRKEVQEKGAPGAGRMEDAERQSTDHAQPSAEKAQKLLQSFFQSRGVTITVGSDDAAEVVALWNDREGLGSKLHTLQQAGLLYSDSGWHASNRLLEQWFAYYSTCNQGPGQKLGSSLGEGTERTKTEKGRHDPKSVAERIEERRAVENMAMENDNDERDGLLLEPATARAGGTKRQPLNQVGPARKRLRGKQRAGDTPMEVMVEQNETKGEDPLEADEYILREWAARHGNPDPRARQDAALAKLGQRLRAKPMLPHWLQEDAADVAYDLPLLHCSFEGCVFDTDVYGKLESHICEEHGGWLDEVAAGFLETVPLRARRMEAYRAAISWVCQQKAPCVHAAIDRRALKEFRKAQHGAQVGTAICFVCAQRFPYTNSLGVGDKIRWKQIIGTGANEILTLPLEEVRKNLSCEAYWRTYCCQHSSSVQEQLREDLKEWTADITLNNGTLRIICCPEDKTCSKRCKQNVVCNDCRAPICEHCWHHLQRKVGAPSHALANDMLIFYPLRDIYAKDVTFMELVCASPCFTAMACFSLEKKYLGDRALDQDAFMPRHRLVARGNATTFPLAWEDLLQNMHAANMATTTTVRLPKTGADLAAVVNVIIKGGAPGERSETLAHIIHQARVRRAVVLELLADAKRREHPAYSNVSLTEAAARAEDLPADGVPPEIIALLAHDSDLDNVQRQKAATPVRDMLAPEELREEFAYMCKPNAVVGERTSAGWDDINAQQVAALHAVASHTQPDSKGEPGLVIHTGNRLLDQFESWYFAFAFAFLFPYGSAMPDPPPWSTKARHRRPATAPRVELSAWMRCMARRCEAQINRDWTFGFTVWNLFFRSSINLSRHLSAYDAPIFDEKEQKFRRLSGSDVETGALQLVKALEGTYSDTRGRTRSVNGDVSKLAYVKNLGPAARKLLRNMRHIARALPGTQEARRQMRFEISAMRIRYGVPLFVTVSPDEAHQWLFVRMTRSRASDPVRSASAFQEWMSGDREFPPLDDDIEFPIHVERLRRCLPGWQQRRTILARDPLASVDGFHVLLRLLLRHVFGVNVCHLCPDCEKTASPCMDCSGSNAALLGGVFGRMEALYVTIEAQKSTGSLHGHMQCFLQCLHQHTPLTEIFEMSSPQLEQLRREYCRFQAHAGHSVYSGQMPNEIEAGIAAAEATWPEHALDTHMTRCPEYQRRSAAKAFDTEEAVQWQREYLEEDVVKLQYLKQHHFHPKSSETGDRVPLRGCRKNRLGALHGPYGHPYLNPCHPAILAAMRGGNNDVQVPYRLPYACSKCGETISQAERRAIALAAQRAQDAQTGYCSDYCSKNQPMGFHEIKEFQKGHVALHANLQDASVHTLGKRHANRFLSDAYCKGVVRGQVECCNLRANHVDGQIVAAERISTASFEMFPGQAYVRVVDALHGEAKATMARKTYVKTQRVAGSGQQHLREAKTVEAYGHRPTESPCWWLSPYEFTMHWDVVPTRVPHSRAEWEDTPASAWDVVVTAAGQTKLNRCERHEAARLQAGTHYCIAVEPTPERVLFARGAATAVLRHNWYLQRRPRPRCPQFAAAPVPQGFAENAEKNAKLTLTYFRAWTLDATRATFSVPYAGQLLGQFETWEMSLRHWLTQMPSAETKRYVGNFLSVYRVRPATDIDANSDDDDVDEPFQLDGAGLAKALQTQTPAAKKGAGKAVNDDRAHRVEAALAQADAWWKRGEVPGTVLLHEDAAYASLDSAAMQKSARRKPAQAGAVAADEHASVPGSVAATSAQGTEPAVRAWAARLPNHTACNAEQREFCAKVAARVATELHDARAAECVASEPLRWVLHGGPGTGKSHTLKMLRKELFEEVLGWQHGVHFQIVSFQAVMAELLDGDTIHHALGLDWSGDRTQTRLRGFEKAQQTLQWRWLILDEFSMVSAELLAQLELRCRELMRDLSVAKYSSDGRPRPFGGLNVILAGDLYQLPPPKGTFLGDIPWDLVAGRKATKQATALHGQTLLWGGAEAGMQGVTELVRCERTGDMWLTEVQEELRRGQLSNNNHAFLHGAPTTVPGSWTAGRVTCQVPQCAALVTGNVEPRLIKQQECTVCAKDRKSRELVIPAKPDERCQAALENAVAIFGTNDIKYHVNKRRAMLWASSRGKVVHLAVARDKASATVLQEKPDLLAEKLQWLQRHDKECGGLYGLLPLCVGMPVRATEHLDRRRGILKGCRGTIVGWSPCHGAPEDGVVLWNKLPEVVYVKFDTTDSWQIDGMPHSNVYPVAPCKRVWFLDRQSKNPQLRVWRTQLPLAPAFAITAHVAQGQTVAEGVLTDLCVGVGGNPFTAYVAFTRVKGREHLFIYRAFDAAPFQRGIGLGRDLLLRQLRGDRIDWKALLAKYCEERPCSMCAERKQSTAFTTGQWKRDDKDRVCRECTHYYAAIGTPWRCNVCKLWHAEDNFPQKHRQRQCSFFRVCLTCELKKPCVKCGISKAEAEFGPAAWKARNADRRCCRDCAAKLSGYWHCHECEEKKPRAEFSAWQESRAYTQNGTQACNACVSLALVCRAARRANQRLTPLRQRVQRQRQQAILEEVRKDIETRISAERKQQGLHTSGGARLKGSPEAETQRNDQKRNSSAHQGDSRTTARELPPRFTTCLPAV
eukprot:s631_g20.t1